MYIDCDAVAAALDGGMAVCEIREAMEKDFKEFLAVYREEEIRAAKTDILLEISMLLHEYSLLIGGNVEEVEISDEVIAEMDKLLK